MKLAQKLDFGLGAHVRVTGTLNDESNLRILESEPGSVETLSGTQQVEAKDVKTGDVGESTEGLLVRINARVTRPINDELPYGYELYVDDGSALALEGQAAIQQLCRQRAGVQAEAVAALARGEAMGEQPVLHLGSDAHPIIHHLDARHRPLRPQPHPQVARALGLRVQRDA